MGLELLTIGWIVCWAPLNMKMGQLHLINICLFSGEAKLSKLYKHVMLTCLQ